MKKIISTILGLILITGMLTTMAACNSSSDTDDSQNNQNVATPNDSQTNNQHGSVSASLKSTFDAFQIAFEMVAKENAGFNTFGWDTGDSNGDRIRNSVDEGDINQNNKMDEGETWTGRKIYLETWTGIYTLNNPADANDKSAIKDLEIAINHYLDDKYQIAINADFSFSLKNNTIDDWGTQYHGLYITNAIEDKLDRGAFVIVSNGLNKNFDSQFCLMNGDITGNVNADDYFLYTIYTYQKSYGEVVTKNNLPDVITPDQPTTDNDAEVHSHIYVNGYCSCGQKYPNYQDNDDAVEKNNVDISKLIKVDFGKWNGYATPIIEVDYEYFETLLSDYNLNKFINSQQDYAVKRLLERDCSEWFTVELIEQYANVKNGDKLKAEIILADTFENHNISFADFENGLGLNFNGEIHEYIVDGLSDDFVVLDLVKIIEPFVTYSGANGYGEVNAYPSVPSSYSNQIGEIYVSGDTSYFNTIKLIYKNKSIAEISFYAESDSNLKEGDVAELCFDYGDIPYEQLEELGYVVIDHGYVTVPDLGEYLTSKEQLTPVVLENIKKAYAEQYPDYDLQKMYLATYKPGIECPYNVTTLIVNVYYKDGWLFYGYTYNTMADIIVYDDGSISIRDTDNSDVYYDLLEEVNESILKKYEFTEVYSKPADDSES